MGVIVNSVNGLDTFSTQIGVKGSNNSFSLLQTKSKISNI